jgi:hypothetical protein
MRTYHSASGSVAEDMFGWTLITDDNRKALFMAMVRQMDMSFSYKPILLKAILLHADDTGRIPKNECKALVQMV